MSNWTPKQALSGLMSKFRRSDSEESSSSSSEDDAVQEAEAGVEIEESGPVSRLALADEKSPEAWLGRFLHILDMPTATERGTLAGAQRDPALLQKLQALAELTGKEAPLRLLDATEADSLKAADWGAWWRAQEALGKYGYAVLSLSLLGDRAYISELRTMYTQETNSRILKDTHFVLCSMLSKEWPSYQVKDADFAKLASQSPEAGQ